LTEETKPTKCVICGDPTDGTEIVSYSDGTNVFVCSKPICLNQALHRLHKKPEYKRKEKKNYIQTINYPCGCVAKLSTVTDFYIWSITYFCDKHNPTIERDESGRPMEFDG